MVDKVRTLKMENPADGGTDLDLLPTEINPAVDYSVARGFIVDDNENIRVDSDGSNNMTLRDPVTGIKTLAELAAAAGGLTSITITNDYNAADIDVIYINANANDITVTLPTVASSLNTVYIIKRVDSASYIVTITGNGSETIDDETDQTIDFEDCIKIICDSTQWRII